MNDVVTISGLDDRQQRALEEVALLLPGVEIVLIGALGLGHHIDMGYRSTDDVDLVVGVEFDEFPGPLALRLQQTPGCPEHRFYSTDGVQLDVLPAGPKLRKEGKLAWPSGQVMNLLGFDLAFQHREQIGVSASLRVSIPRAPVFLLLKVVAWTDRPADRPKDLQDIAYLLENYLDDVDDRHWSDEMIATGLDHDLHSAYALGFDLGTIANPAHIVALEFFLAQPPVAELASSGPLSWTVNERRPAATLEALAVGLAAAAR